MNQLATIKGSKAVGSARSAMLVPAIVAGAGDKAAKRFLEFFAATIRNKNTRQAYYGTVRRFFAWCEHHKLAAQHSLPGGPLRRYPVRIFTGLNAPALPGAP